MAQVTITLEDIEEGGGKQSVDMQVELQSGEHGMAGVIAVMLHQEMRSGALLSRAEKFREELRQTVPSTTENNKNGGF